MGHRPRSLEIGQWLGRCPRDSFLLQAADNGCLAGAPPPAPTTWLASPTRDFQAHFCYFCCGYYHLQASKASSPSSQSSAALRDRNAPCSAQGENAMAAHLHWSCQLWHGVEWLPPGSIHGGHGPGEGCVGGSREAQRGHRCSGNAAWLCWAVPAAPHSRSTRARTHSPVPGAELPLVDLGPALPELGAAGGTARGATRG